MQNLTDTTPRWAVYYSDKATMDELKPFDVLVLDGDIHPDLQKLKDNGAQVLGYISVGEVHDHKAHEFADQLIIETNDDWGSKRVDIRQPEWQDYIINKAVPAALNQGFDGVMLDTLDAPLYLQSKDPERFAGSREAAIYLVRAIHYYHPNAKIMINRAFDILPEIGGSIDSVLAESILSNYDLKSRKASHQPDAIYKQYVEKISALTRTYPHINVYSLDYWDMNDSIGVSQIYATQRSHGFIPYVTTPSLGEIHTEPRINSTIFGAHERT